MNNKVLLTLITAILLTVPAQSALAEEVVVEPTAPAEPEYTPPPEASEGVGGWAVVDPETGAVHGVVVCEINVCGPQGSWAGKMPIDYQGCGNNCVLRFQTRATADGNVAGWSGSDGSVKWNENEKNFTIQSKTQAGSYKATLVPELTARDSAGMDLHTGLVQRYSLSTTYSGVKIRQLQEDYLDENIETRILFPEWGQEGKLFAYDSEFVARSQIENDVDAELIIEGYVEEENPFKINEENVFVRTVREWVQSAIDFFRGLV